MHGKGLSSKGNVGLAQAGRRHGPQPHYGTSRSNSSKRPVCILSSSGPRDQPCLAGGSLALTLISNWKPYNQVTPTAVSVGWGAAPQYSGTIFQIAGR